MELFRAVNAPDIRSKLVKSFFAAYLLVLDYVRHRGISVLLVQLNAVEHNSATGLEICNAILRHHGT